MCIQKILSSWHFAHIKTYESQQFGSYFDSLSKAALLIPLKVLEGLQACCLRGWIIVILPFKCDIQCQEDNIFWFTLPYEVLRTIRYSSSLTLPLLTATYRFQKQWPYTSLYTKIADYYPSDLPSPNSLWKCLGPRHERGHVLLSLTLDSSTKSWESSI